MTQGTQREAARERIVVAAAKLLREEGPAAVTTRRVAQEAGLQPPALYRLFEGKDNLLDAAAERVFAEHVARKRHAPRSDDPVEELRAGWRTQIDFGLANPTVYGLLLDPERARRTPAQVKGARILSERVHRIAAAGRLRVSEERAVNLIRSAGTGTVHTLLTLPPGETDPGLAETMFELVARAILTDEPVPPAQDTAAAVAAFRTLVPVLPRLTPAEAGLLDEWLRR